MRYYSFRYFQVVLKESKLQAGSELCEASREIVHNSTLVFCRSSWHSPGRETGGKRCWALTLYILVTSPFFGETTTFHTQNSQTPFWVILLPQFYLGLRHSTLVGGDLETLLTISSGGPHLRCRIFDLDYIPTKKPSGRSIISTLYFLFWINEHCHLSHCHVGFRVALFGYVTANWWTPAVQGDHRRFRGAGEFLGFWV